MNPNILQRLSLKTRVTLFTLAIFLVGIWSLAFYASRMLRKDMQRLLGQQQFSTVALLAAQINDELGDRLRDLELVGARITPALMGKPASLQAFVERQPVLRRLFNGGLTVFDREGTVIADVPLAAGRVGANYMDRDYVAATLKEGRSMIGRPVMARALKKPIVAMTVPIRGARGKVIGAFGGPINLGLPNFLSTIMEQRYGRTGGYLLIAPQYRMIVTATDTSRVMQELPAAGMLPVMDRFLQGFEGTDIFVDSLGVEQLVSYKGIPAAGWKMAAVLPTAEAFAPIHDMQRRMLLAAILLTLMAGGLTWWMLRRQLAPMLATVKTLAALSDSEQPLQPLPVTAHDEIGDLIGGFNRLLEAVGQREAARRASDEQLRAFYSLDLVGLAITSPARRWLRVNRCLCQMLEYSEEELRATTWSQLTHPEDLDADVDQFNRVLAGDIEGYSLEKRFISRTGRIVPANLVVRCTRKADGAPDYITAMVEDITERKRLQELHLQAQKLESLGTLAGGIAHDFNNILAAIRGNADLAAANAGSNALVAESIEEIRKASSRAGELVRRITAFARPAEARHKEVDLREVVAEVLKLLRATLPAAITLRTEFGAHAAPVLADAGQIHEAIVNLTNNATHAIGQHPGEITYRLEDLEVGQGESQRIPELPNGRYVCLTVTDTGCGMDAATMARIFDAFYTTKSPGEGTGLGLSMLHGIMKGHGGAVCVESASGKGSSFRLYFPALSGARHQPVKESAEAAVPVPGQRVLYVDDEAALISLAQRTFSRLGHGISVFTDPRQALRAFRAAPQEFDILVTDLSMPNMSGFELAREVLSVRPGMPVLMTTGYIREEDARRAREAGVREIILKPFTIDDLQRLLEEMFRRGELNGKSPAQ